jgi:hypothetical protein
MPGPVLFEAQATATALEKQGVKAQVGHLTAAITQLAFG